MKNMAIKVSVYEDNMTLLDSLSYLIRRTEGLELCSASPYAVHILTECQDNYPDVILMDMDMPELSGIEATRLVKKDFPDINIMMLTVFEDEDKIFEALCAGATGFLLKKTPSTQIITAIDELYHGGSAISSAIARKTLDFFSKPVSSKKREISQLTLRENEMLKRLVMGDSYKMVAEVCSVSIGTVYSDINNLYRKLHVNSTKSKTARYALREKFINNTHSRPENIPDFGQIHNM